MALDLKRKLARLPAALPPLPLAGRDGRLSSLPPLPRAGGDGGGNEPDPSRPSPPERTADDLARLDRIARMRETIARIESRERLAVRAAGPRVARPPAITLPGALEETPHGPLHRISQHLEPAHCHGRIPIAKALEVPSAIAAALALDPALDGVDMRRMLFVDTETTGLSGGTGTLPFLIGLAWFEDESLRVEQLFLRRPGEERPMLARLAERVAACSCLVTYNGKSFDWPLLRTRAIMNRVPVPTPPAHLDLLHCARRVFARRLGQVRLVQIETEVLGMRRERDVDGAEIPHLYWQFVRGAEASAIAPVVEHNANDLIALAGLLAVLGERWEDARPEHEPEDRLGIARIALRHGDLARAERFARATVDAGATPDVAVDALLVATEVARSAARHDEVLRLLEGALATADDAAQRAALHLALAKHLEHRAKDPGAALAHAEHTAVVEGDDACARRIARLARKRERAAEKSARRAARKRPKRGAC